MIITDKQCRRLAIEIERDLWKSRPITKRQIYFIVYTYLKRDKDNKTVD